MKPRHKFTYKECKEAGICPCCRKNKPEEGMALCKRCRETRSKPESKKKQRELVNKYVASNRAKGLCDRCKRPAMPGTKVCQVCADKAKEKREAIRSIVLAHYGNKCACCGETERQFLTMDHINNDGHIEKKTGFYGTGSFYSSIIKRGFPKTYQILCWNCNCAKGKYGVCPHQRGMVNETERERVAEVEGLGGTDSACL